MTENDTYKTIKYPIKEILYKENKSKFFGYAFPVLTEDDAKIALETVKNEHPKARHWCYAYQIGTEELIYRANDDGEPNNSAGLPIYGQIQSFNLTNILIIVVRYFGGVKLGVGGLINAYKTTAQLTIEASNIIEKTIDKRFQISFEYKNMNTVMRIIKEKKLNIIEQNLNLNCKIIFAIRKLESKEIYNLFKELFEIDIQEI